MAGIGESKLCADNPRPAATLDLWSKTAAQLGKGGEDPAPVASLPSVPPSAATETSEVSAPSRRNSGSEKRQRDKGAILVRLLPEERAAIEIKARAAGVSLASFARAAMLGSPGPRARRSPTVDAELLAFAIAAINKVGSNLNQIAYALNARHPIVKEECLVTLAEVRGVAALMRESVGRRDHHDRKGHDPQ